MQIGRSIEFCVNLSCYLILKFLIQCVNLWNFMARFACIGAIIQFFYFFGVEMSIGICVLYFIVYYYFKNTIEVHLYERQIKNNPQNIDAFLKLAHIKIIQGKINQAVQNYQKIIKLDPINFEAYYNKGIAEQSRGQIQQAIKNYLQVIELNPKYKDVHYNLGNLLLKQEKYQEAKKHFRKAIKINIKSAKSHFKLAVILSILGQSNEAIKQYQKTIQIEPNHKKAFFFLGAEFQIQENKEQSIKNYKKAIEIDSNDKYSYFNLNKINSLKDKQKSIKYYRKTFEIDQHFQKAHQVQANMIKKQESILEVVKNQQENRKIDAVFKEKNKGLKLIKISKEKKQKPIEINEKKTRLNQKRSNIIKTQSKMFNNQIKKEEIINQEKKDEIIYNEKKMDLILEKFYFNLKSTDLGNKEQSIKQSQKIQKKDLKLNSLDDSNSKQDQVSDTIKQEKIKTVIEKHNQTNKITSKNTQEFIMQIKKHKVKKESFQMIKQGNNPEILSLKKVQIEQKKQQYNEKLMTDEVKTINQSQNEVNFFNCLKQDGISDITVQILKDEQIRSFQDLAVLSEDILKKVGIKLGEIGRLRRSQLLHMQK